MPSTNARLAAAGRGARRRGMAIGVGLVVAACSSTDDAEDPGSSSTSSEASTTSTEASTTSTTTDAQLPAAADGTDVAACADGTCEVLVEAFPVEVPLDGFAGLPSLTLRSAGPDGLASGRDDPRGTSTLVARIGGSSTYDFGNTSVVVEPVAILDGAAVVRFSTR